MGDPPDREVRLVCRRHSAIREGSQAWQLNSPFVMWCDLSVHITAVRKGKVIAGHPLRTAGG